MPAPSQKEFWKAYAVWARWVVASGNAAVQLLQNLEQHLKPGQSLKVDNFRFMRGLMVDAWRVQVTGDALSSGVVLLNHLKQVVAKVEKAGWVEWQWSSENSYLHRANGMFPVGWVAGCWGGASFSPALSEPFAFKHFPPRARKAAAHAYKPLASPLSHRTPFPPRARKQISPPSSFSLQWTTSSSASSSPAPPACST